MIYFATTRDNDRTIHKYLEGHGAPLASRITPVWYEQILAAETLPAGTWCFADLELLSDPERETAARVWQGLDARGCRLLNHPTRSLRRYDLLRALHAAGSNRFNVHHPGDLAAAIRLPVFLHGEHDHLGRRSDLLHTREELEAALETLQRSGERLDAQLVTEFCDTRDADGIYRKYAAFIVGDTILPRHLFFEQDWQVKKARLITDAFVREERSYVDTNPHEKRLREIFALACINYGRIDYSLQGGEIQVWEINTNPVITFSPRRDARDAGASALLARVTGRHRSRPASHLRAQIHTDFAAKLQPVWEALDA
jgi:hypothetical protein